MSRDDSPSRPAGRAAIPSCLEKPQISLVGSIQEELVKSFLDQLRQAEEQSAGAGNSGDIAMELTTLGGDAELARRIVLEIEQARRRVGGRFLFLGKTAVYSAGITIMSAFPKADRYLAADATLLIHCRQLEKTVELEGPLRASLPRVEALKAELENGLRIETQDFNRLILGSDVTLDELWEKALYNWYLSAEEAAERGLVARVVELGGA